MSLIQKCQTNSYCVCSRHYSGTNFIGAYFTTSGTKILKGNCNKCKRNKSMTVGDATIETEELKDSFKSFGRATANFGKKLVNIPARALEITSKIGSATANRNTRANLSATLKIFLLLNTINFSLSATLKNIIITKHY